MCPVLHLSFFVLFISGFSEYYHGSFLSGDTICDFSLLTPSILYKLALTHAQNNMRKL